MSDFFEEWGFDLNQLHEEDWNTGLTRSTYYILMK